MKLPASEIHKLTRWNTPSIANAIEQITAENPLALSNREDLRDFTPELAPMAGYAMTLLIAGASPRPKHNHPANFSLYREYLASVPGPKIVVVQDLDRPECHGSFWGEVGASNAIALGCVGAIVDGAVRDIDEMRSAGFKTLARRLAVSHAHCWPIRWGVEVEVFGTRIKPGQLIHADKHGFTIIPDDAHDRIVGAVRFMDDCECETVLAAARASKGCGASETLENMDRAAADFGARVAREFSPGKSEWT